MKVCSAYILQKFGMPVLLIGLVVGFFLTSYSIGMRSWWHSEQAMHDDACTLGHALTMGLDFDLDYRNEVSVGKYANSFRGTPPVPPGIGVLSMPFVSFFSLFDRLSGHPVIQDHHQFYGSWSFFGVGFAASFYFLLGTFLYFLGIRKYTVMSPAFCFLLCAGTGMLYYVLMRPMMAHAYEYFNLALNFYASTMLGIVTGRKQYTYAGLAALAGVLSWLTRLHALFPLLLPPIVILGHMLIVNKVSGRELSKKIGMYLVGCIAFFIPAVALMYGIYDAPFPRLEAYGNVFSYLPAYTSFLSFIDKLLELVASRLSLIPIILFGSSFPLWCFMAVVFWGICLLVIASVQSRAFRQRTWFCVWGGLVLLYMAGPISAVLIWRMPGSAYGFRYLLPLIPLGILGISLWRMQCRHMDNLFSQIIISLLAVCSFFGALAPVVFNTNPYWGYTYSEMNEFGFKEGVNAKDNLYRTIAWLKHPSFLKVAISTGPSFAFRSKEDSSKSSFIRPVHYRQVYVMTFLWALFIFICIWCSRKNCQKDGFGFNSKLLAVFSGIFLMFVAFLQYCYVSYQSCPEVVSETLSYLSSIREEIEEYKKINGTYRKSDDFSELGLSSGGKILYRSDGQEYKIIVSGADDSGMVTLFYPDRRDPARPWWAYGYWTPKARKW